MNRSGDSENAEKSVEGNAPDSDQSAALRDLAAGSQQEARDGYINELDFQRKYSPATALSLGFRPVRDGDSGVTGFQIVFGKSTPDDRSTSDVLRAAIKATGQILSGIESGIVEAERLSRELTGSVSEILRPEREHPRSRHTPDDMVDPYEMPMRGEWIEGGDAESVQTANRADPYEMPMKGEWIEGRVSTASEVEGVQLSGDGRGADSYRMPMRGEWAHLADYQREMNKVQEKAALDEKFRRLAEDLKQSGDFVLGSKTPPPLPKPIMPMAHDAVTPPLPKPIMPVAHDAVTPPLPKPIMPVARDAVTPPPLPKPIRPVVVPLPEPLALAHSQSGVTPYVAPRQLMSPLPENIAPQPIHLSKNDALPILPLRSTMSESVSLAPAPVPIERAPVIMPVPIVPVRTVSDFPSPVPSPVVARADHSVTPMVIPVVTSPLEAVHKENQEVPAPAPVRVSSMPPPINLMPSVPREAPTLPETRKDASVEVIPVIRHTEPQKNDAVEGGRLFSLGVHDDHVIQQAPAKPYPSVYSLPAADRMRLIGVAESNGLNRTLQARVSEHGDRRRPPAEGAEQAGHLERPMYGHYSCSNGKDSFDMNLTLPAGSSKNGPIATTVGGLLNVNRQRVVSSTQLDGRIITDANGTRYEGSLATYAGGQLRFTAERVVIPFRQR